MPARLDDLRGEPNYLRIKYEETVKPDKDTPSQPDPSLWELRNYLAENIAIPLGSEYVRENLDRGTFINFFGPHGSGKTLAVRAIAYETDAMVVDLSPSTIENQYPVAQRVYIFAIMRHIHNRHRMGGVPSPQVVQNLRLRRGVQRRHRLIQQQRPWTPHQRPRQRSPLPLST